MRHWKRALAVLLCAVMLLCAGCGAAPLPQETEGTSELQYIFVHGLSGWGRYDKTYRFAPYWGTRNGDLMEYLGSEGYRCHAASVDPIGSAWDRACELYAQLTGSVVDYGAEHSARCNHARFGTDYSDNPLIPDWNAGGKIVLLGHSFGGATVRLFAEILASGSAAEQAASPNDLSPFFLGGQGDRLHALVTLAAPTNGTTAYDLWDDPSFDPSSVNVPKSELLMGKLFDGGSGKERDERIEDDFAAYDMHIDNALALNATIETRPDVYYFAVPCSATYPGKDGTQVPKTTWMEGMFRKTSRYMGAYSGITAGGVVIDDRWKENDGLVNTVSSYAPIGAPAQAFDPSNIQPGVWNEMPVFQGDHMSIIGGMTIKKDIRPFYLNLLQMIDALPQT